MTGVHSFSPLIQGGRPLADTTQFKANRQGEVTAVSRNALGRAWAALTRTDADRQSNRAAAHAYVDHVRSTYGGGAALLAQSALADRIEAGKPLSMRAIRVLESRFQAVQGSGEALLQAKDWLAGGEKLGSGSNNSVFLVTYRTGLETVTGVLKEVESSSGLGLILPFDEDMDMTNLSTPTQVIERNLACERMAHHLNLPVIAKSLPAQTQDGKPALMMERIHGETADSRLQSGQGIIDSPDLRRALVGLQILDFLTAQRDRNLQNIMLKREGDRDLPVGIDNDISFVTNKGIADWNINASAVQVGLPSVIDFSMQSAIEDMTIDDLRSILGPELATEHKLSSAHSRLLELQRHVDSKNCLVIDDTDWDMGQVEIELRQNPNNYWAAMIHPAGPDSA